MTGLLWSAVVVQHVSADRPYRSRQACSIPPPVHRAGVHGSLSGRIGPLASCRGPIWVCHVGQAGLVATDVQRPRRPQHQSLNMNRRRFRIAFFGLLRRWPWRRTGYIACDIDPLANRGLLGGESFEQEAHVYHCLDRGWLGKVVVQRELARRR